ncbi:hypothetical protein K488DRAFT_67381 [Vararia minispora EC-137]|uniref:Uncharacterized protein n=1 Tax=Vararia minispora EC-137 TaxID=1314806 RepID=A0ACB8QY71_9AGAM|nr:hypothetical protein K488DRAFT_67381 [Vararia minispora EC-137]
MTSHREIDTHKVLVRRLVSPVSISMHEGHRIGSILAGSFISGTGKPSRTAGRKIKFDVDRGAGSQSSPVWRLSDDNALRKDRCSQDEKTKKEHGQWTTCGYYEERGRVGGPALLYTLVTESTVTALLAWEHRALRRSLESVVRKLRRTPREKASPGLSC